MYEIAVLGAPSALQLADLEAGLRRVTDAYQLTYGADLRVLLHPDRFSPAQSCPAVAVFFGGPGGAAARISDILDPSSITVIPVASSERSVGAEIPHGLQHLNCILYDTQGADRLVATTLECLGLLRRQRRIFLSYRRNEARSSALQLFDALSARGYDVFLDTHGVPPAEDFQGVLWHKLCDVDVMVMLETPSYFLSRWTSEEYGRALAKNIGVLRVQWPDTTPSIETQTSSRVELIEAEIDPASGALATTAIDRIGRQLEQFRGLSHAVRRLSMTSQLQIAVERLGGKVLNIGSHLTMHVTLPGDRELDVSPVVGVPDSSMLQEAIQRANGRKAAILYDHVGVLPTWNGHLEWLGKTIAGARWIRSSQAAWDLAQWEA
jgi:hypothetical protein